MQTNAKILKLHSDTAQLAGHPEDADAALVLGALAEYHTAMPGIIQSFDKDAQTATVQPAIKRLLLPEGELMTLPLCVDVPVCFFGNVLTFEVTKGMSALLVFSERAIDAWHAVGGVVEPTETRVFDLSDAMAIVGFNPRGEALPDVHATASELRTRDGLNRVSVRQEDGTVHVGAPASISPFVPLVNGAVMARGIEPYTKMTYGQLGAASLTILVKP